MFGVFSFYFRFGTRPYTSHTAHTHTHNIYKICFRSSERGNRHIDATATRSALIFSLSALFFLPHQAPLLVSCYSIIIYISFLSQRGGNRLWCGRRCCYGCCWHWMSAAFLFFLLLWLLRWCSLCLLKHTSFQAVWRIQKIRLSFALKKRNGICLLLLYPLIPVPQIKPKCAGCSSRSVCTFFALFYAHTFPYWMILTRFNVLFHFSSKKCTSLPFLYRFFREFRQTGTETTRWKEIAVYFMANISSTFSIVVCFVVLTQWRTKNEWWNDEEKLSSVVFIWLKRFDASQLKRIVIIYRWKHIYSDICLTI